MSKKKPIPPPTPEELQQQVTELETVFPTQSATNLPADVTRCTGYEGKGVFRPCPIRQTCARYRDYLATHIDECVPVPLMFAPKVCNMYIHYLEP